MTATPDLRHLAHGHGLNTIDGYRVVVTVVNGEALDLPELVATFDNAASYATALAIAETIRGGRRIRRWAVIDTHYVCGCWSDERDLNPDRDVLDGGAKA